MNSISIRFAFTSVCVALFVLLLTGSVNYFFLKKELLMEATQKAKLIEKNSRFEIESLISSAEVASSGLKRLLEEGDFSKENIENRLTKLLRYGESFFGSTLAFKPKNSEMPLFSPYFYKKADSILYSDLASENYNYITKPWYKIPVELEKPIWSEPYFDEGGGNVLMSTYSNPVFYNDELLAILTIDLSLQKIQEMVSSISVLESGYAFLLSKENKILSHPDNSLVMKTYDKEFATLNQMIEVDDFWFIYVPIVNTDFTLAIVFPEDELFSTLHKMAIISILLAIVGSFLLVLTMVLASRRVTEPLRELTKLTVDIAKGNFTKEITIPKTNDETSKLSTAMSTMQKAIKRQQEQLKTIATTDVLTDLGNRYKLINDINSSKNPALAIVKIDDFSELNDFYGYKLGDHIVKQIGINLSNLVKSKTTNVYHIQGDRYVLFNPDIDKEEFTNNISQLLKNLDEIRVKINEEYLSFNFTTGISFEDKSEILTTADMALQIAIRGNENIVLFIEEISLNKEYENNIFWTKKIKQAILDDCFVPVYQPIVNNKNKIAEKYESLVRLRVKDRLISPSLFLEISKKTKHYPTITKTMIEKTFEIFKDNNLEFSLNLTIEDILNKEIEYFIVAILNKYDFGSRVVFEIVESESIENFEEVLRFLNIVKSFGCKIAIDDFGTGYSNFVYLMRLSPDYIKIDGSLIKEIDTNTQAQVVVTTIVDFAKKMGIKTIAEFVENEQILNKVIELDIDYSQGYFFSEPKVTIPK